MESRGRHEGPVREGRVVPAGAEMQVLAASAGIRRMESRHPVGTAESCELAASLHIDHAPRLYIVAHLEAAEVHARTDIPA